MPVNIHEVLERVRSLILAETPSVTLRRDYDISLPEISGDREQLIQAMLNIARNAAQAHARARARSSSGPVPRRRSRWRSRRYRLACELEIIDNGPGIPGRHPRPDFLSAGVRPRRRQRPGAGAGAELHCSRTTAPSSAKAARANLFFHLASRASTMPRTRRMRIRIALQRMNQ